MKNILIWMSMISMISIPCSAFSNEINENSITFYVGSDKGLLLRKKLSQSHDILINTSFIYSEGSTEENDEIYDSESSKYVNGTRYSDRKGSQIVGTLGLRTFLDRSKQSFFLQNEIGLAYLYQYSNYYSSIDENKIENMNKSHTLGGVLRTGFGTEYHISSRFSLSGLYSIEVQYLGYKAGGNVTRKQTMINDSASVQISYYW